MLKSVTPVILTYNEENNLKSCLSALAWAERVVVVDSFSSDATLSVAADFPNVEVFQRAFDRHADQWNFAIHETRIGAEWILSLDADYVVTPELASEIENLRPDPALDGYIARFRYCIYGRPLRASLYPEHVVLFRRGRGRYVQAGHTQRLEIAGPIAMLANFIDHDDRKSLSHWIASQQRYATLEARYLSEKPPQERRLVERIRSTGWMSPFLVLVYMLVFKRCFLDGRAGWSYVLQRVVFEALFCLEWQRREMIDAKLSSRG